MLIIVRQIFSLFSHLTS